MLQQVTLFKLQQGQLAQSAKLLKIQQKTMKNLLMSMDLQVI
jgi:hypothetical protein